MSSLNSRLRRLEKRGGHDSSIDLSGPIDERDLAFLDEYERIAGHTTVAERQDPARARELTRLAAEAALRPFGFSDEDIAAYVAGFYSTPGEAYESEEGEGPWVR